MIGPLYCAWLSVVDRLPVPYEQFKTLVADFEITPVHVRGEAAGCLFVRNADIHACVLPKFKGHWFSRSVLRLINRIIAKHGYAQTNATTEDGKYFVTRLGFVPFGENFRRHEKWELKQ